MFLYDTQAHALMFYGKRASCYEMNDSSWHPWRELLVQGLCEQTSWLTSCSSFTAFRGDPPISCAVPDTIRYSTKAIKSSYLSCLPNIRVIKCTNILVGTKETSLTVNKPSSKALVRAFHFSAVYAVFTWAQPGGGEWRENWNVLTSFQMRKAARRLEYETVSVCVRVCDRPDPVTEWEV